MCAQSVASTLKAIEGVEDAIVNFSLGEAEIEYVGDKLPKKQIAKALKSVGYQLLADEQEEERQQFSIARWVLTMVGAVGVMILAKAGKPIPYSLEAQMLIAALLWILAGWPFTKKALLSLRHFNMNMDVLIFLGTTAALVGSIIFYVRGQLLSVPRAEIPAFFESVGTILAFVSFGKWLEHRALRRTNESFRALLALKPAKALLIKGDGTVEINASALGKGDLVRVPPGEIFPADGIVKKGISEANEATMTGEPGGILKSPDDEVLAGTLNLLNPLDIEVTSVGGETLLGKVISYVKQAQLSRHSMQRLADRISAVFVPVVILIAICAGIYWLAALPGERDWEALKTAVAILVVACPCTLGLATPTAIVVAMGKAARHGLLVRNAAVLEQVKGVDTVVFDKTGTLTTGKFVIREKVVFSPDEQRILEIVNGLEQHVRHPISRSIVSQLKEEGIGSRACNEVEVVTGKGVFGYHEDEEYIVGSVQLLRERLGEITMEIPEVSGKKIWIGGGGKLLGYLVIRDEVRKGAVELVEDLHKMGIETMVLSGDDDNVVKEVGTNLGIGKSIGNLKPVDKAEIIRKHSDSGRTVLMLGDGVNDTPAFSAANLSVAMGGGNGIALQHADAVLLKESLPDLLHLIYISRRTHRKIVSNLFWAFIYNILMIPVATGVLIPFGIMLEPWMAALAMSVSSVTVVINSLTIRSGVKKES